MKTNRNHLDIIAQNKLLPSFKEFLQMISTFTIVTFAWIFFRAENIGHAIGYINKMITSFHIGIGYPYKLLNRDLSIILFIIIMLIFEWIMRKDPHPFNFKNKSIFNWIIYIIFALVIIWFSGENEDFIYFQF